MGQSWRPVADLCIRLMLARVAWDGAWPRRGTGRRKASPHGWGWESQGRVSPSVHGFVAAQHLVQQLFCSGRQHPAHLEEVVGAMVWASACTSLMVCNRFLAATSSHLPDLIMLTMTSWPIASSLIEPSSLVTSCAAPWISLRLGAGEVQLLGQGGLACSSAVPSVAKAWVAIHIARAVMATLNGCIIRLSPWSDGMETACMAVLER